MVDTRNRDLVDCLPSFPDRATIACVAEVELKDRTPYFVGLSSAIVNEDSQ